jgi:hypothetical protein
MCVQRVSTILEGETAMNKKATNHPRFLLVSAVVLALGLLPAVAGAAVLAYEPFDYPDGSLTGNDGWATYSGTAGQVQVIGGEAELVQTTQSEDTALPFTEQGATDKTYASFKVRVLDGGGVIYFAHFKQAGTFFYFSRVYIAAPTGGGDFTFGLSNTSTLDATWASDFTYNTWHQIVISYDAADANGHSEMWVDPVNESSTKLVTDNGFQGDLAGQFGLREASGGVTHMRIDDIVIGQSFDDVINVPTPTASSTWGRVKAAYR